MFSSIVLTLDDFLTSTIFLNSSSDSSLSILVVGFVCLLLGIASSDNSWMYCLYNFSASLFSV